MLQCLAMHLQPRIHQFGKAAVCLFHQEDFTSERLPLGGKALVVLSAIKATRAGIGIATLKFASRRCIYLYY
ncbi:hypothetical protein CF116_02595 [Aeromonas veronii]|nr:hypothetical protein CF116_02595 [Aeromonas veronii]